MASISVSVHVHIPDGSRLEAPPEIFSLAQDAGRADFFGVGEMTIPHSSKVIRVMQFQLRGQGRLEFGEQLVAEIERLGFEACLLVHHTSSGIATSAWWPQVPSWPTWEWHINRIRDWFERGGNNRGYTGSTSPQRSSVLDLFAADADDRIGDIYSSDSSQDPADATASDWIGPRLGEFGTVGGLAPEGYDRCILVDHSPPGAEGGGHMAGAWLLEPLAEALAAATDSPDKAWFAIWEGYGFDEDVRRGLERLPCFKLPGRRYHLLTGRVTDGAAIKLPALGVPWPPDLWWPEDRRWFVATDTDISWSYVSGDEATISAVESLLPNRTRPVTRDQWNDDANPFR